MRESPDAIVIGAGLGGLCAAFEAARNGLKVLLAERHNLPGGFATSFVRGRFEFEPALHEMPALRDPSKAAGVPRYLKDEAELDIDFLPVPEAYRVILTDSGHDVTLPFGTEPFIRTVSDAVPGSGKQVREYMEMCAHTQEAFGWLSDNREKLDYRAFLRKYGNFVRTGAYTAEGVADAMGIPRGARDLIYPYWCYLGVPMDRVSFPIWASLLDAYTANGAVIPALRSHEIASAFIDGVERHGGSVLYNTRVERICVEDGEVTGVVTDNGRRIPCRNVIADLSPTTVFGSMIHPDTEVPQRARVNIAARKPGLTLMVVYLGLSRDPDQLGIGEYSYFIAPHMETSALYENIITLECNRIMQAAVCLNRANPACSPAGTTILSITAGYRPEAWSGVEPRDYLGVKHRLARQLIGQFETATGTDIMSHIEEFEIATPQTFARYTGAHDGVIYGYEPEPWDSIIPRTLAAEKENYIRGLRFCGGYGSRCHGYGSSILSGKAAVEALLSPGGRA